MEHLAGHPARVAALLLSFALLAGCQTKPPQTAQAGPQLRFEVMDLTDPDHITTVTAKDGDVLDFHLPFSIEVRAIATDPAGLQALSTHTLSYTPGCDGEAVPRPYRTKLIVYPDPVVAQPQTATRLALRLPLYTQTLFDLGVCDDAMPTSFHVQASAVSAGNAGSGAGLTVRVGFPPAPAGKGG